jgi:hypothetical protein
MTNWLELLQATTWLTLLPITLLLRTALTDAVWVKESLEPSAGRRRPAALLPIGTRVRFTAAKAREAGPFSDNDLAGAPATLIFVAGHSLNTPPTRDHLKQIIRVMTRRSRGRCWLACRGSGDLWAEWVAGFHAGKERPTVLESVDGNVSAIFSITQEFTIVNLDSDGVIITYGLPRIPIPSD